AVTDAALFKEWQLSRFEDFEDTHLRFQELSFDYTFTEEGTTYVRFMCANADGSCEAYGDVYTVSIGASSLKCPNAFSPNGDGVNDEWKVSYSSIVSFDCHIFDRYGHEMASFSDPSLGWDGKYKGKLVPSGAYYYVIKARGADGKNYKLSGDINIVNYEQ
ncbi:MAG: T9SS type B sorting domain-containing protein, partial [Duncaniella sp.]|nr:T9SS type B sorting domain-containing protein [Duncaniella sp.]